MTKEHTETFRPLTMEERIDLALKKEREIGFFGPEGTSVTVEKAAKRGIRERRLAERVDRDPRRS
jgi:hypothetical protein